MKYAKLFCNLNALAIILVVAIAHANGQASGTSTTAIEITQLTFTPESIDVTNSSASTTITVRVTDTERDFEHMGLWLRPPNGYEYGYDFSPGDRISGNARDGVYRKVATFSQFEKAGTWSVTSVIITDQENNSYYRYRYFTNAELVARGLTTGIQVINNNEITPPELIDLRFTQTYPTSSPGLEVVVRARDLDSGISHIGLSFSSPEGCYVYDDDCITGGISLSSANLISGDEHDGIYSIVAPITWYNYSGRPMHGPFAAQVYIRDKVTNSTQLTSYDLWAMGFPSGLLVGPTVSDYDGLGRSDFSVWRPSNGTWYIASWRTGEMTQREWGLTGDKIVPADFDADGITDMAVYRPNGDGSGLGRWYVINSSNFSFNTFQFGINADVPLPQDFDGDGRADLCVFRPADSTWYMVKSTNNLFYQYSFGIAGDKPVPADYSGDRRAEIAVWRPSDGSWHTVDLTDGTYLTFNWGIPGDVPVPGDYSGDGRADYAVYRPANNTWYRMNSNDFFMYDTRWGVANDIPVPGDYDGDGRLDFAICRPAEGRWYVLTASYQFISQQFGIDGDIPTESAFVY